MPVDALPRVYRDAAAEYQAINEGAGLYDNSAAGRLMATGEDALDLINRLSTNRVVNLPPGGGAPTILTTDRGRILDLLGVVNMGDHALLLTSPGRPEAITGWLDQYTILEDLAVADLTPETALLTVCGPESGRVLAAAMAAAPDGAAAGPGGPPESYSAAPAEIAGGKALLINRPWGRLPAWEALVSRADAPRVWAALTAAGAVPVGQEAGRTALVQQGVPRYGRELGEAYNPLEAGLIGAVDFAKGCYIGQEVIARLDTYRKVQRRLARLRFSPGAAAAEGAALEQDGRRVGQVTSLATLPATGELIGLGYVRAGQAAAGARLTLSAPGQGTAEVVDLPQLFGPGE